MLGVGKTYVDELNGLTFHWQKTTSHFLDELQLYDRNN